MTHATSVIYDFSSTWWRTSFSSLFTHLDRSPWHLGSFIAQTQTLNSIRRAEGHRRMLFGQWWARWLQWCLVGKDTRENRDDTSDSFQNLWIWHLLTWPAAALTLGKWTFVPIHRHDARRCFAIHFPDFLTEQYIIVVALEYTLLEVCC